MKYYSVNELKIGQRVKISELGKIVGVSLFLDPNTIDYSSGDPEGTLVAIGEHPKGVCYMPIERQDLTNVRLGREYESIED